MRRRRRFLIRWPRRTSIAALKLSDDRVERVDGQYAHQELAPVSGVSRDCSLLMKLLEPKSRFDERRVIVIRHHGYPSELSVAPMHASCVPFGSGRAYRSGRSLGAATP
jgi:hypothetical protein